MKFTSLFYWNSTRLGVYAERIHFALSAFRGIFLMLPLIMIGLVAEGCVGDNEPEMRSVVAIGDYLPEFSVEMDDGSTLTTDMLRGRDSMIVFFTTACADCRRELPRINAYAAANPQVNVICIARSQSHEEIKAFWKAEGLTMPYSPQPDASVFLMFATAGVPRIYCADPQLCITAIYVEHFE